MTNTSEKLIENWQQKDSIANEKNRSYLQQLKQHKPPIIEQLQSTHSEVFEEVDCLQCANCCKTTPPLYTTKDIKRIARHLAMSAKQFKNKYVLEDINGDLVGIKVPCSFLNDDNTCSIYEVRPLACRTFPHTDDSAYVHRPQLNYQNTIVCPAAYHIVQRLQEAHPLPGPVL